MLIFDTYYHIYNHANGDDNLFREQKNYDFFLKKYHQHIDPIAETIAWCLMPNHFHLLVRTKSEEEINFNFSKVLNFGKVQKTINPLLLSKQFSNFFSSYTQAFNKLYNRRGSLFIKNFKRKEVTAEDYLKTLVLYIHLNPVHHGFTKNAEEWKWSSYGCSDSSMESLLISLFGDLENYKWMHQSRGSTFEEYNKIESELTF